MTPGGNVHTGRGRRALFFWVAFASPMLLAGCGETAPLADLTKARFEVERAAREGAAAYAPEELSQARQAWRDAQRAITLQSSRLPPRRSYAQAGALLERTRFYAVQATRLTQVRRAAAQRHAETELSKLREALARSREIKRFLMPRDPSIHRLVVGAEVDLEVARKKMAARDYPGALASAESGADRVREVEQLLLSSMVRFTSHPDLPSWRRWVEETVHRSRARGEVAFIVDKLRRKMTVYRAGKLVRTFTVDLGMSGMERKLRSGDDATPEGLYKIEEIRGPGQTKYYRAFLLDYPNQQDRRRFEEARKKGLVPRGAGPGNLIEIHGEGGRDKDWTRGCVALTNREMDELVSLVKVGTPVTIVGYNPRDPEKPW